MLLFEIVNFFGGQVCNDANRVGLLFFFKNPVINDVKS